MKVILNPTWATLNPDLLIGKKARKLDLRKNAAGIPSEDLGFIYKIENSNGWLLLSTMQPESHGRYSYQDYLLNSSDLVLLVFEDSEDESNYSAARYDASNLGFFGEGGFKDALEKARRRAFELALVYETYGGSHLRREIRAAGIQAVPDQHYDEIVTTAVLKALHPGAFE